MRFGWVVVVSATVISPLMAYGLTPVPPITVFAVAGLLGVCAFIASVDSWAGALCAYLVVRAMATPHPVSGEIAFLVVCGGAFLALAQRIPVWAFPWVRTAILTSGLIQILLILVQTLGYDPLWLWTTPMPAGAMVHGTFGNSNLVGAFLAVTAVFVPVWILPLWGVGILLTKSALSLLAFLSVLVTRYRDQWRAWLLVVLMAAAAIAYRGIDVTSWAYRWAAWKVAFMAWLDAPLFGIGLGGWSQKQVIINLDSALPKELFLQLHNDPLQLLLESGLVGLVLLGCWMLSHWRTAAKSPYRFGVLAVGVVSLAVFPFQVPPLALGCLLVMGIAVHKEDRHGTKTLA